MTSALFSAASAAVLRSLDDDVAAITAMFASLAISPHRPSPVASVVTTTTANGRVRRTAIYRPDVLADQRCPSFVGFFGERRSATPSELVAEVARVDDRMLVELETIPGVAAYCSWELDNGNWANLVVLGDDTALPALHANPTHRYAAHRLSPMLYTSIRLHRGHRTERATITSTKQYEFALTGAPRVSVINHCVINHCAIDHTTDGER